MKEIMLVLAVVFTAGGQSADNATTASTSGGADRPERLTRALADGGAYSLRVDCTGDDGARSLEIFEDGIAIFNGRLELALSQVERDEIARILATGGFATLGKEYGGKPKPERAEAPARILCSIRVDIDGLSKQSRQFAGGEQSQRLLGLADDVLDSVEKLADARGTGAASLADGLEKVAAGELSPHALMLRVVHTPADGTGRIVEVADGQIRVQPYAPGERLGRVSVGRLNEPTLSELTGALRGARIAEMPNNLWFDSPLQLRASVLEHETALVARDFTRLGPDSLGEVQQRFDALVATIMALAQRSTAAESRAVVP